MPICEASTVSGPSCRGNRSHLARLPALLEKRGVCPVETGAYWQLSYTHNMRSRTRYVRPEEVGPLKPLLANFKRFRRLVDRCIDLSIKIADRQTQLLRPVTAKSR